MCYLQYDSDDVLRNEVVVHSAGTGCHALELRIKKTGIVQIFVAVSEVLKRENGALQSNGFFAFQIADEYENGQPLDI